MTVLFGDGGIGKSALLRAWLEAARARSCAVATVSNFPFARDPYAPIAELCRNLARTYPRAVPRGENRTLFTRFLDLLPIDNHGEAEPWQKRRLFVLVREFFERLASATPFVLAIDDAHWLDPESLELLTYLAPHFSELRAVLVLACRGAAASADVDEVSLASLERHPSCYRIVLGPLAVDETRELIYSLLPAGRRFAQRTIDDICRRCADTPLFAEALVRSALDGDSVLALPASVEQSVNDHLARLERADASLLEAASVIGLRIDLEMLEHAFEVSDSDATRVLRSARELGLVVDGTSGELQFGHEFIREAVYARLTSIERRAHHRRVAAYLESRDPPATAAERYRHVHGANKLVEAAAIAERAGDDALARFAFATARNFYDAALTDDVLDPPATARVAEKLGEAHDLLGSHREAATCFSRADAFARAAHDHEREAGIAIRLALAAGRLSDPDAEMRHCERALVCCAQVGPNAFAAEVLLTLHHVNRIDAERASVHLQRADALIPDRADGFGVRHLVARAAVANLRGDLAGWRAASFDAVAAAEAFGDPAMLANVWSYVADYARLRGEPELARRGFADAIATADRYGLTFTAAKSRLAAADMAFSEGRVADAHDFVREAAALQADGPYARMQASAVGLPIALAADDAFLSERLDDVELLETLWTGELQPLAVSFIAALAELRVRQGDPDQARRLIERALPRVRHAALIDSALLRFARYGDARSARTAANLLESTADRDDPIACVHIPLAAAIAAAAEGDRAESRAQATIARERAVAAATPLLDALACEIAGDDAAAQRIYSACGALGDVRRLAGPQTSRATRAPSDLTRRESEVAVLIADGLSNRAIAERLSVSERTVEHHVAATFGKLGFRSRAQLAAFMSREPRESQ
jgi:DNA-binding CsgD family transcriptional regulator/DNA-binding transcriptional ArsR family regulator